MATILIRDVPEEVAAALKAQAEKHRRSKEKQALVLIEAGLRHRRPAHEVLAEARKLRQQCTGTLTLKEIMAATETEH
jgi:plasmid stability protein